MCAIDDFSITAHLEVSILGRSCAKRRVEGCSKTALISNIAGYSGNPFFLVGPAAAGAT
jgi:hypothetical protein